MSEISEAAGVSRATLYRYFPSKEHVLAAAADYDGQRFRAGLDHALAAAVGPEERIAAFMSYSFAFIRTHSARSLFESEPEFVMSYLLAHLPSLREEMLVRVGSDLDAVPAVRRGELNREQLADLVVRLFASSWIIPEPDDDSLVESLTQILHIPTTAPAAMEANR
jgi:AcrR family transcriptional regulator